LRLLTAALVELRPTDPAHPDAKACLWVAETARGLGIGRRLLAELEASAAQSGATRSRLETNRTLTEAISLYRSVGYVEVAAFNDEPLADHWFEKLLPQAASSVTT
jgi:ribosomal protein S18 acetylase RimI-like enzyme